MATRSTESFKPPTREFRVLRKRFRNLLHAISNPDAFSAKLIPSLGSSNNARKFQRRSIRNYYLLKGLMIKVISEPAYFSHIISVLQNDPPLLSSIAEEMKREYGKNTQKHYSNIKTF